ncbi:MAG: methyltransferase domain-containing protein [Deltaproteobacteria bacterium]
MSSAGHGTVYEHLGATRLAADGIRPGGLALTTRALSYCLFAPGSRLLDIGCGSGVTLHHLHSVHRLVAVGIDPSPQLVAEARRKNPSLPVIRGGGGNLPFCGESFDGAILECTLSLMENPVGALDECRRVLRHGGRIILSDLYARNPAGIPGLRSLSEHCCLRGALDPHELERSLLSAGFEIDLWEDHSDLLKQFAFQFIWTYGSLDNLWVAASQSTSEGEEVRTSVRESRPGYFLLVGHRKTLNKPASRQGPPTGPQEGRQV